MSKEGILSILKKTEQDYFAKLATKAKSESTLRNLSAFGGFWVLRSRLQRDSFVLK